MVTSARPVPSISGIAFHGQQRSLRALVGEDVYQRSLANLPQELQDFIKGHVVGVWVPGTINEQLIQSVSHETGRSVHSIQRECVERTTKDLTTGMWKPLLRMVSTQFLLERAPLLWPRVYNFGKPHIEASGTGHGKVHLHEASEASDFLLRGVAFTMDAMLTEVGHRAIRVQWHRTPGGALYEIQSR